jgi:hypothetical protein
MEILNNMVFGDNQIRFKTVNGQVYGSLTDMAKASNKLIGHWLALDNTKEYLKTLESIIGITTVYSKVGGVGIPEQDRGTWGIEEVILKFAGWCNPTFEIWCYSQIKKLLTEGKVELNKYESLEQKHFQTLQYMDDEIAKGKSKAMVAYDCFSDFPNGDPNVFVKHLREENARLKALQGKHSEENNVWQKKYMKLQRILRGYFSNDMYKSIFEELKNDIS